MKLAETLERIGDLDPIDDDESMDWYQNFDLRNVMHRQLESLPRRHRRRTVIAVGAGTVVLGIGTAAAATGVLGGSAPDAVKQHLAGLDEGMPADLRYDPDLEHARAVAVTPSAALYMADAADGGYCLEVASDVVRPRGATCVTAGAAARSPLEITAPIPSGVEPLLVAGRANDGRIAALAVEYPDGSTAEVSFGLDRAWLVEVPANHREATLENGLTVLGLDSNGTIIVRTSVPALRADDPTGDTADRAQPIFVSTISDGDDLTLVLGLDGKVNVPATALALQYPDGTTVPIDLAADGSYRYDVPVDRQGDFSDRVGVLVATDDSGATVATAPVGSVAYWRSAERSS
jgi:hypothetical protein